MAESSRVSIRVEVAYAEPDAQTIVDVALPAGATIREAIEAGQLIHEYPDMDPERHGVGVWSKLKKLDDVLRDGDRVEIYRPLKADPREVRRRLAAEGKVMGRRKKV